MAIFTAIGAAAAAIGTFIGGLGVVGTFLLRTAVGVGLNLLAQKLAGKPAKGPDFSTNGRLQGGGDVPRSFGVGYYATAGSLVYANTWGNVGETNNAYFTQVIALSDMPIAGLAELWVGSERVTIGATQEGNLGFPIAEYAKNGKNHLWVKFYDGTQTTADPLLVGTVGSYNNRPYQSTRVGRGVAYAIVTAFVGQEAGLFQGFPSFKFGLNGMRLYDQTRDSSRGGSGSQRVGLANTWGGDGDHLVAVQIANLLMGVRWNGVWQYGIQGMTVNRLPSGHWLQQIAKCRAPIAGPNGNEPSFRAGGEIPYDAPLADAIEALLTAGNGRLAETGGFYKVHVGAPDAPVMAFTDGEILSTDEQSFTPFFGLSDTVNGIVARHPSPEEGWNVKSAPPLYAPAFEAEDGNRRLLADVPLDFVPYKGQVQRLMQAALREARRARRHTLVLPPEYWTVEPGDVIRWTSVRNGYVDKLFRVDGVVDRANLDVMVDITEIDPADYDWNQSTDYRVPVDGPVGPLRPAPMVIVDWFAVGDVVRDNAGNERGAAIRLSWDGNQPGIAAVEFQVRLEATGEVVLPGRTQFVEAGNILISHNIRPNVLYGVQGRYISKSEVENEWSGWLSVTTPDVRLGPLDVYFDIDLEEINDLISDSTEWIREGTRDLIDEMLQVANTSADQELGNYNDRQQLRIELTSGLAAERASYLLAIDVATGPGSALAQRIESLEVTVEQDIATAVDALTTSIATVDGRVTANSNSITALSATVGNVEANVTMRGTAQASPGGGWARWGVEVRQGSGGAWSSAAFFLDTAGSLSRAVFVADQFVIRSPAAEQYPFVFANGRLTLNLLDAGLIRSGRLLSLNNRMDVDLNNARILISDNT